MPLLWKVSCFNMFLFFFLMIMFYGNLQFFMNKKDFICKQTKKMNNKWCW